MAASSSSSPLEEVDDSVELRTVVDLEDTAISARYFSQDAGAEGDISSFLFLWPKAASMESKPISQREIQALCDKYGVPACYTPGCRAGPACAPPPEGSICVYADALEAGMRLPLHDFYVAVLLHYGLAPSQLAPTAWRYMAAFVLLCQDVGVEPMLSVFRYFFSICSNGGGWYHFKHYGVVLPGTDDQGRLFTGKQHGCTVDWKLRFFNLKSPLTTPWPCSVKWGKPCRDAVRVPPKTRETMMAVDMLLDRAGSSGLDLMSFLSRRSLPVGKQAILTPEQRLVKLEEAAAAGPTMESTPTTRKRKGLEIGTQGPVSAASCGLQSQHRLKKRTRSDFIKQFTAQAEEKDKELAQLRTELAQLKKQLDVEQEAKVTLLVKQQEVHAAEFAKQERVHLAEFAKQELRHAAEFAKQKRVHAAEFAKQQQEHATKFAKQEKVYAAKVAWLNQKHGAYVAQITEQLKKEHNAEVAQLTEQLNQKHAVEVAELNEKHDANVTQITAQLKKEHDAKVAQLTQQLNQKHAAEVAGLSEKHA